MDGEAPRTTEELAQQDFRGLPLAAVPWASA